MVLLRTIDNLKERPKHEREAVAFWIAIAVVIVLLIGWGIFFFRSLAVTNLQPVTEAYTDAVAEAQAKQEEAQKSLDTTGWVSNSAQPAAAAGAVTPDQIQIIQEENVEATPQTDSESTIDESAATTLEQSIQ